MALRLHLEAELRKSDSLVLSLSSDTKIRLDFHLRITHLLIFYLVSLPFISGSNPNRECQVQFLCWPRVSSDEREDPGLPISLP